MFRFMRREKSPVSLSHSSGEKKGELQYTEAWSLKEIREIIHRDHTHLIEISWRIFFFISGTFVHDYGFFYNGCNLLL